MATSLKEKKEESKNSTVTKNESTSTSQSTRCILVIGAAGQIGTELLIALRKRFGNKNVIGVGRKSKPPGIVDTFHPGPFQIGVDICKYQDIERIFTEYPRIDTVYHLAAILSGDGESNPMQCWEVNVRGTLNLLECVRKRKNAKEIKMLLPSSIAAFGPDAPSMMAPQNCGMHPSTMYGITKVTVEMIGDYYARKYGMYIRGLRLPGIISSECVPSGGTTDYAVCIFYDALQNGKYSCFLKKDTRLPMLYMPDCIDGMIALTEFNDSNSTLTRFCDYNVTAYSFTPRELATQIRKHIPGFEISYNAIDPIKQSIADSWPDNMDDFVARKDWQWKPKFTLSQMVADMIHRLRKRKEETGSLYPQTTNSCPNSAL